MYDIVGEFEEKGRQKATAEALGTLSPLLISTLEQRFSGIPDSLKESIGKVTDVKRMGTLLVSAGAARSLEEFAKQLAV